MGRKASQQPLIHLLFLVTPLFSEDRSQGQQELGSLQSSTCGIGIQHLPGDLGPLPL